jgi:DNA-binding transcriptional MerR regulator
MVSHARDWNPTLMKISELSEMTRINKSTIHHYVRIGLLPPALRARHNLYLYNESHLHGLAVIKHLKKTENLSLEQIKKLIETDPNIAENHSFPKITAIKKNQEQVEVQTAPDMHEIKKLQIIDRATILFSKSGYEAVKVSDITDALQIGKGTFYLYFKNKRELLLACLCRLSMLIERLEQQDQIRREEDFYERSKARWLAFNEKFDSFRGVLSLIRTACRTDEKSMREKAVKAYYAWIEPVKKDLEHAMSIGAVRPMDAELSTFGALGAAEGLAFRLTLDSRYSVEEAAESLYSFLKYGYSGPETYQDTRKTVHGCRVIATDVNEVSIELSNTHFAGTTYLFAKLGQSEIKVDPSKLTSICISSVDGKWFALLTAKSGQEISLEIDGSTVVTGDTQFGSLEIPIERVSRILFAAGELNSVKMPAVQPQEHIAGMNLTGS